MGILAASFPGIFQIQRVLFSAGHGRNCVAVVDCLPQFGLPAQNGTLFLTDGIVSLTLPDCRIDKAHMTITTGGHIVRAVILARNWRWRYGEVSGVYNVRNPDGTLDTDTEKTPQELATLCFQAMNEPAFDVSLLPNNDRPEVNWFGTPAWSALEWLCSRYGCDYGLDVAANAGRIWRIGQGNALPAGGQVVSLGYGIDTAEPPDRIKAFCGPTEYQFKFALECVLEDTDGTIKPIDDVSYKPEDGWEGLDPADPLGPDADPEERALAKKLYRMWRIVSCADGTLDVPGYGTVSSIKDLLPVHDKLAESYDGATGTYRQPAYLVGTFAVQGEPESIENVEPHTLWEGGHRIDSEEGIVHLPIPAFKYAADKTTEAATMYLIATCYIRKPNLLHFEAHTVTRTIANNGTGDMPLHRPEIHRRIVAEYPATPADDAEGQTATGTTTNQNNLDAILNQHLDAVQSEFATVNTEVRHYLGIAPFAVDGALRQYQCYVDMERGAGTIISLNTEWEPGLPNRAWRRRNAQVVHDRALRERDETRNRRLARAGRSW